MILNRWHNLNIWALIFTILALTPLTNSYAEKVSLKKALDSKSLLTMLNHENGKAGSLTMVSVDETLKNSLGGDDRIAGYPIKGLLKTLKKRNSLQLATIFLDDSNYVYLKARCFNQVFNGIRFISETDKVEVAIGIPCNQVIVSFKRHGETQRWGGVLASAVTEKALTLLAIENE